MSTSSIFMLRRDGPLHWWRRAMLPGMLLAVLLGSGSLRAADVSRRYELRAVLLLNLLRFVEWPEEALGSTNSPVVIGVVGYDQFGPLLEEAVRDEQVHDRRIEIRRYYSVNGIDSCHLLYISASEQRNMGYIMASLRNRPILTVSDARSFIRYGGMIRLFTKEDGKTGLRINPGAAKAANLKLSALLLQVAEIVNVEDD